MVSSNKPNAKKCYQIHISEHSQCLDAPLKLSSAKPTTCEWWIHLFLNGVFNFQGQLWEEIHGYLTDTYLQNLELVKDCGRSMMPTICFILLKFESFFQSGKAFCFIVLYAMSSTSESHKTMPTTYKLRHLNKRHQLYTHSPTHEGKTSSLMIILLS